MTPASSTQFAAQIGQLFGASIIKGVWMTIVMFWGIFLAAWPIFLIFGVIAVVSLRFR